MSNRKDSMFNLHFYKKIKRVTFLYSFVEYDSKHTEFLFIWEKAKLSFHH